MDDSTEWDGTTWLIFIVFAVFIAAIALIFMDGQKQSAQACISRGGRWIEYAKDYYGCVEAR